jgi:hypothetical protein
MRRKALLPTEHSKFTEKTLHLVLEDLQSGRHPSARSTISDDRVAGLRAEVMKTGNISYNASYTLPSGERPYVKIGTCTKGPEYCTVEQARERTKTIKALGDKGIDVRDGLFTRLWAELDRDGPKWKPTLNAPAKK